MGRALSRIVLDHNNYYFCAKLILSASIHAIVARPCTIGASLSEGDSGWLQKENDLLLCQVGNIDVEGTDEEEMEKEKERSGEGLIASSLLPVTGGGMDILSHDLQYSSSSSSEGEEEEEEELTDMEEV